jgi:hypothetical protein
MIAHVVGNEAASGVIITQFRILTLVNSHTICGYDSN